MLKFPSFKTIIEEVEPKRYVLCSNITMVIKKTDEELDISVLLTYKNGFVYSKQLCLFNIFVNKTSWGYKTARKYIESEISDICGIFKRIKQEIETKNCLPL